MNTAIVLGGGWAGLSAAVELAEKGFKVTLLEQSGRLGGRASSFTDKKTGDTIDNGQHLFMGCYDYTLRFLKKIGSMDQLEFQKNLQVHFVNTQGQIFKMNCLSLPSPLHLFSGLWSLETLSLREKISMFKVYSAIQKMNGSHPFKSQTVEDWLIGLGQSERSRKYFWDLITLATLNESPSVAEAHSLAVVLKEAFFSTQEKARIAIAAAGLSDLCGPPSERYLNERNGSIALNKLVSGIVIENDSAQGIVLRDGTELAADVYVSALPFHILKNLLNESQLKSPFFSKLLSLQSSAIFSISLWFDRPVIEQEFLGMLDTRVQWVFNKSRILKKPSSPGHLSLVISGARDYLGQAQGDIVKMCLTELQLCFPQVRKAKLLRWLVQREKNATLSPQLGFSEYRLPQRTPVKNFFLCGDWTDTGFPATIESAVLSAAKAVNAIAA